MSELHKPESYFEDDEAQQKELPPYLPERMRKLFSELEEKFARTDAEKDELRDTHNALVEQCNELQEILKTLGGAGRQELLQRITALEETISAISEQYYEKIRLTREVSLLLEDLAKERQDIERLISAPGGQA